MIAATRLFFLITAVFSFYSHAQVGHPAVKFIDQVGQEAFKAAAQGKAGFCRVIKKNVELGALSRFILDDYARQATPQQMAEVSSLLNNMLAEEFKKAFSGVNGGYLNVRQQVVNMNGNSGVRAELHDSGNRVRFRFQFQVTPSLKIVDAQVEGRSIARGLRDQYLPILRSAKTDSAVSELLAVMRTQYPPCP